MKSLILKIISLSLLSPICHAHSGDTVINHWLYGFLHPFTGFDHFFTLVAIGMLAARSKQIKKLILPGVFLGSMIIGFIISMFTINLNAAETVIAISLILLGTWLISGKQLNDTLVLITVSFCALAHGYVHGTETTGAVIQYLSGFVASTFLLILFTLLAFRYAHPVKDKIQSTLGMVMATLGFVYLLQG